MSSLPASSSETRPSASRLLRQKIGWVYPRPARRSAAPTDAAAARRCYVDYLCAAHGIVRASVPLMEAARECSARRRPDPVSVAMTDYLDRHIVEEQNHDEWILDDLAVLGVSREAALRRMPSPAVATLVGSQYYWIRHHHPIAVLGYIAVLEGSPPDAARIDALLRRTGLPRAAFRTLLMHARLDPGHREDLDRLLDALPLDGAHTALLGVSVFHTVRWLNEAIDPFLPLFEGDEAAAGSPPTA